MFLPEIYGLEYNVPRKSVHAVTPHDGLFGKSVRIELQTPSEDSCTIELWLKHRDQFLQALATP
jgi:hypothetical protein